MKKLRFVIALVLTLCFVQGSWAIGPGGTLGGGGKSAQRHPANEGKTVSEPGSQVGPVLAPSTTDDVQRAPIIESTQEIKKVVFGKHGSEAQSNDEMDYASFAIAMEAFTAEKELRSGFKAAIAQYRLLQGDAMPESPVSSSLLWLTLLPMLLPPLVVYMKMGGITSEFWISVLLTPMLLLPGIVYAVYVVLAN